MRRSMITHAELMSQLRQQGIDDPACVKEASIEGDGRISIIPADETTPKPQEDKVKAAI